MRYSQPVSSGFPSAGDRKLIQIVDAALAETTRKSGEWLACRLGCTQCCFGVFAINQLDALRLKRGLAKLEAHDPQRAETIRQRARKSVARIAKDFPGDRTTGILDEDSEALAHFEDFANDEPCPVLDLKTGLCELYEFRPMTCRVFGPPVRSEHGLGVCELCFQGATDDETAACEMIPDPDDLEAKLVAQVESKSGRRGSTIIAFCLAK
jgi:Fe-S-cluster containining protein